MPTHLDSFPLGGDLPVSRIGYGAMRLTGPEAWGSYDLDAGTATLRGVVDAGITLVDTADCYGPHANEELIRSALTPYADDLVIATKGGYVRGGTGLEGVSAVGNPDYLRQSVRASLRRLGRDRIDLYYLHSGAARDASYEEQVGTLAELRDQGLIRHIGLSNLTPAQFESALAITPIAAVTAHYNVASRDNQELVDAALAAGAAFVPWQPLSLSSPGAEIDTEGSGSIATVLADIARAHDATVPQVALAWLLGLAPAVIPIPATTSLGHLRSNLGALDLHLTAEETARITSLT